jgi:tol-pal system protein YbgF
MKQLAAAFLLVLSAACASTQDDGSVVSTPMPQAPVEDPRVAVMQTQMTELLERLDVLNDRIARMEAAPAPAPAPAPRVVIPPAATPAPAAPAASVPQAALVGAKIADDYRTAIMLYGRGRVADSRRAFQEVFEADPTGDLADNALFWIGETYFGAADYSNAMRYYARVTAEFSDQNKAPDALFKTGLAQARTGDLALARKTYQEVIARYPYSTPAASARHELERIKF